MVGKKIYIFNRGGDVGCASFRAEGFDAVGMVFQRRAYPGWDRRGTGGGRFREAGGLAALSLDTRSSGCFLPRL